jgi:type 2 lantibiotic biosynthesis protein LanM
VIETCTLTSFLKDYRPCASAVSALDAPPQPNAIPFADAFSPIREYATICFGFRPDLADDLVEELSRAFSHFLLEQFAHSRDYRGFIRWLWNGGWPALFGEYPVLERLLDNTVALKTAEALEFTSRAERDLSMLRSVFAANFDRMTSIRSGLSDPHRGLRSVKILEFASGERLVYKPKELGVDAAWSALLDWVSARSTLDLRAPRVFDRGDYGWVEYVPYVPIEDEQGIQRFYRRSGSLLAILYAIRGTDCHFENVIAHGEYPVLVDTETLFQPNLHLGLGTFMADEQKLTVAGTGFLPSRDTSTRGEVVFSGGLDDTAAMSTASRLSWRDVNTDSMTFGQRDRIEFSSSNVPQYRGQGLSALDYVEDVVEGFSETYSLLMRHRDELLSSGGPLARASWVNVRFLLRNTRVYSILLRCAVLPRFLHRESDYTQRIHQLLTRAGSCGFPEASAAIEAAEAAALASLDVPMFTARTDSTSLFADAATEIAGVIALPGYDAVANHIRQLNTQDLAAQAALIRASFDIYRKPGSANHPGHWREMDWSRGRFEEEARHVADSLLQRAQRDPAGDLDWSDGAEPLGHDLWDGRCGVALFLAALFRLTGESCYIKDTLAALRKTRRALRAADSVWETIGAGSGLGSVIYALARTGEWLDDPDVSADARLAARFVDMAAIQSDHHLDVMQGAAGCILGLLAINETEKALACAEHILNQQRPQAEGGAAWEGNAPKPVTGFAHGAAGIAYALLRLYARRPEERLLQAAHLAIEYERANYSAVDGNWLDVRALCNTSRPRFAHGWCHGAPGIGLARVGSLDVLGSSFLRGEIDAALDSVESFVPPADSLCCGKLASIELMLCAESKFGRSGLYDRACRRAAAMLDRTRSRRNGYASRSETLTHPGLFAGLSGLGYQLLRLAHPDRVPAVLLWE